MRLESLGKPYLVQAQENSGKHPKSSLVSGSLSVQKSEPSKENSTQENMGRVLEFISRHRKQQQNKEKKERGQKIVEEYKRVEQSLENLGDTDALTDQAKGQKLNIKA